jgi:hypothetical protein
VGAQDDESHPSLEIPLDTVARGGVGAEEELAVEEIPAEAVGWSCDVVAAGENNESVHPNNDIIVRSGDSSVELLDVEREAGAVTEGSGTVTLGETLTVHVRFGADKVFSGGMVLSIDCPTPPAPTTTTTTPATTTTAPPAETPAPPAVPVPGEPDYTG